MARERTAVAGPAPTGGAAALPATPAPAARTVTAPARTTSAAVRRISRSAQRSEQHPGQHFGGQQAGDGIAWSQAVISQVTGGGPAPASHLQRAMRVSAVDDPLEREAEAIASRIGSAGPLRIPAPSDGQPGVPQRQDRQDEAARAVLRLSTGTTDRSADGSASGAAAGAPASADPVGPGGGEVPAAARDHLAAPGAGAPLDPSLGARLSGSLGADLSAVRVHTDARANAAAAALGARAFTVGRDVSLAAGESATDLHLMAHEATHVVQQQAVPAVFREPAAPPVPAAAPTGESHSAVLDALASFVDDIPGYTLMTVIAGYDPIRMHTVARTPENLVAGVIGLVPFGNDLVARLRESQLVQRIFTTIEAGLTQHNLTRERLAHEISTAWDELSILNGIDGNLAIIARHLRSVMNDVLAFATQMADAVMAAIREAAVGLAEKAVQTPAIQPTWSLATKMFHRDPLREVEVQASTVEIITDLLHLARRDEVLEQLRSNGQLQKAADWIDGRLDQFRSIYNEAVGLFSEAWEALSPANVGRLIDIVTGLAERATGLFARVVGFVQSLLEKALEFVKEALLGRLSAYARRSRGFPLLCVVLGADPFTGEPVPRTAENLVHGFIALLPGGEETYAKLQESGAITQAGVKIEAAMTRLGITADFIGNLFSGIWNSFTLQDLLQPIATFERILTAFEEPLERLFSFISTVVMTVVEVILQIMNFPVELLGSIMGNIGTAFDKIVQDPVGFLLNLLGALKAGVSGFLGNAITYIKNGLVAWLTHGLKGVGITLPADFSLGSVLGFVFDVLGVTLATLWDKLAKHVGAPLVEKLKAGVELAGEAWGWLTALMNEGLGALWRFLGDKLDGLWSGILDQIEGWVVTEVIEAAGAKLLSMLDPTGVMAVINSCVAFFRAVQSAVEYLREILGIINEYTSTLAAVATGNLAAGAQKLEAALAHAVPVAIGFLAKQVGLANVPEKVLELIGAARELIDQALDWLIGQAVRLGGAALRALGLGGQDGDQPASAQDGAQGEAATGPIALAQQALRERITPDLSPEQITAVVTTVRGELAAQGLSGLELRGPDEAGEYAIHGSASPLRVLAIFRNRDNYKGGAYLRVTLHVPDAATAYAETGGARQFALPNTGTTREAAPATRDAALASGRELLPIPTQNMVMGDKYLESRGSGGVIEAPETGATKLELLTFSAGMPDSGGNGSHAERQLLMYLRSNPVARTVTQVDATLNVSPCGLCCGTLTEIADLLPNAQGRLNLQWLHPWTGPRATKPEHLGLLQATWRLTGTLDGPERDKQFTAIEWEKVVEEAHKLHSAPALAGAGGRP